MGVLKHPEHPPGYTTDGDPTESNKSIFLITIYGPLHDLINLGKSPRDAAV
jgi:hypothetical protein